MTSSDPPLHVQAPPGTVMQSLQQAAHTASHDYVSGSPHLKHRRLRDRLLAMIRREIGMQGEPSPEVLEVGGGHGGYTESVLAYGCSVTATEMSLPSVDRLRDTYGLNPRFSALFDPDGSLQVVGERTFPLILCASVLHHIPDYVGFLRGPVLDHLAVGGSLVTIQDPLWYPTRAGTDALLTRLGYLSWRVTQGRYLQGVHTQVRRFQKVYDQTAPQDMVEYHVVRQGVAQDAIVASLAPKFDSVSILRYWSTQSPTWQWAGERLGRFNTFATVARVFTR